jgi:nitric-oxide synthase
VTALRDDVLAPSPTTTVGGGRDIRSIYPDAERFIRMFHGARPKAGRVQARLAKVRAEVAATGTYRHTPAELAFGARLALRESGWCPADVPWRGLLVRDLREVRDGPSVAAECARHLRMATRGGTVTPMVTVFAPDTPWRAGPRIRNEQLVGYAGYREPGTGVLGDRRHVEFTVGVCRLGWRPPSGRSAFDLLPLVVETPGDRVATGAGVTIYPMPHDAVLEVPLEHPDLPWFAGLGLLWNAVAVIGNRRLWIGGIAYPAPFNGVYSCRAIGEDVLGDESAYGLGKLVAERLGLDTSGERSLWRDRARHELNRAVLHSFDKAGVRIEHSAREYLPPASGPGRPAFVR